MRRTTRPRRPPWRRTRDDLRRQRAAAYVAARYPARRRPLVVALAVDLAELLLDRPHTSPREAIRAAARRRGVARWRAASVYASMIDTGVLDTDPRDDRVVRWGTPPDPRRST